MGGHRSDVRIGARRLDNKASARPVKRDKWPMGGVMSRAAGGMAADDESI